MDQLNMYQLNMSSDDEKYKIIIDALCDVTEQLNNAQKKINLLCGMIKIMYHDSESCRNNNLYQKFIIE